MEQVTQKNAANAEESASAGEELSGQADTMKGVAGELQTMVGGTERNVGRATPSGQRARPMPSPSPKSNNPSRGLAALQAAVTRRTAPVADPDLVAAGKIDRTALPLDDDFKEF
jgi:hypothetical protein